MSASPFHAGEIALQTRVGAAAQLEEIGRAFIRPFMPAQHRAFFETLPFMVLGTVDGDGAPWATLLEGAPRFAASPDPRTLRLAARPDMADPTRHGLHAGAPVGLLGIELPTRRRNRMNGRVGTLGPAFFTVDVEHSFGNCPQYIRQRTLDAVERTPGEVHVFEGLPSALFDVVRRADTFFVASYVDRPASEGGRQVDVSHRGGPAGFVRVATDGRLTVPDYAGNRFFNTLGNFVQNPVAGLVFADFDTGDVVHITGTVRLEHDEFAARAFEGAERLWHLVPARTVVRKAALGVRTRARSPAAGADPHAWRVATVAHAHAESATVRSLVLDVPSTGLRAGQHVVLRAQVGNQHLTRTYSVSSGPAHDLLRISVKKQGAMSTWLHGRRPGDTLQVQGPFGVFGLDVGAGPKPLLLIGAGVGMTPLLSMAHAAADGYPRALPTVVVQCDRDGRGRPFSDELHAVQKRARGRVQLVQFLSAPRLGDVYDVAGRWTLDALREQTGINVAAYAACVCGPPAFMRDVTRALEEAGMSEGDIHVETF